MLSDTGDSLNEDGSQYLHGKINPDLEGWSLNQVLDNLYVTDYLDKTRR